MRAPKRIVDQVLLTMIADGKEQKEVAEFFGVSPAAICKRLKRLTAPPQEPLKVDSLTPKEKAFCLEMAAGSSQTNAAFVTYDTGSRESARSLGETLMKNTKIQEAISELMERKGLGREYRVEKLKTHVESVDPSVSIRALDMSFKLGDDYPGEKTRNFNLNLNADASPVDLSRWVNKTPDDITPEGESK